MRYLYAFFTLLITLLLICLHTQRDSKITFFGLEVAIFSLCSGSMWILLHKLRRSKPDKDFVANAAHELRTPITIIRGFGEILQNHPELSPQILRDISDKIIHSSSRLEHLVKSLLTLTSIEHSSTNKFQTIDLVAVAENCRQFVVSMHERSEITFVTDQNRAWVLGDPYLLDLAIVNLLENAIKYSLPPAQIQLSIQTVAGEVQLTVKDKGIGIPKDHLPSIFERFYTVDSAHQSIGLGLSIVKAVVEKHMGITTVMSQVGSGSTFTIRLKKVNELQTKNTGLRKIAPSPRRGNIGENRF